MRLIEMRMENGGWSCLVKVRRHYFHPEFFDAVFDADRRRRCLHSNSTNNTPDAVIVISHFTTNPPTHVRLKPASSHADTLSLLTLIYNKKEIRRRRHKRAMSPSQLHCFREEHTIIDEARVRLDRICQTF